MSRLEVALRVSFSFHYHEFDHRQGSLTAEESMFLCSSMDPGCWLCQDAKGISRETMYFTYFLQDSRYLVRDSETECLFSSESIMDPVPPRVVPWFLEDVSALRDSQLLPPTVPDILVESFDPFRSFLRMIHLF